MALIAILTADSTTFGNEISEPLADALSLQAQLGIDANAERIDARLERLSNSVLQMKTLAEEVLGVPEYYGGINGSDSGGGQEDGEGSSNPEAAVPAIANPVYYSHGVDGAIRKIIDDGGTGAYFAKRTVGSFSRFDLSRLYATEALDPLLIQPVEQDILCQTSFIITNDNLLRCAPYTDFATWGSQVDLEKPRSFWSVDKANSAGIVWTSPYKSAFNENWVVGCLAKVELGGRSAGVVGCEIELSAVSDELLAFSLGRGGKCWIYKPGEQDGQTQAVVFSTQTGCEDFLRVMPVAQAQLPSDKKPLEDLLEEANLERHGPAELVAAIKANAQGTTEAVMIDRSNAIHFASTKVQEVGWVLGGIIESPALAGMYRFQARSEKGLQNELMYLAFVMAVSIALAFVLAGTFARPAVKVINGLLKWANAEDSHAKLGVALPDDCEFSELAEAIGNLRSRAWDGAQENGEDAFEEEGADGGVPPEDAG